MMPWEHVIIGYVGYSLFVHAVYGDSPTGRETAVIVFASILPDLIDKPLAWEFSVFETGYALGHSVFFAIPLSLVIGFLTYRRGHPRLGWAFGIGYLLHLPADVLPPNMRDDSIPIERLLWPVQTSDPVAEPERLRDGFLDSLWAYLSQLYTLDQSPYTQAVIGFMIFGFVLWLYDGMPIVRDLFELLRR
ncbi:metal-dependent hydrolase [Natrialbaceae archaeon A-CW1-1]